MNKQKSSSATQVGRRVKYGFNVAVAVAAAVALAILINWIAYRQFVRFDLTATRQYSLSAQTLKVLENLRGDYQLMTLFSRGGPYIDQARDLVDEYDRYGKALSVQHIDPARDLGRMEVFYNALRGRYQQQIEGLEKTLRDGREALHRTQAAASAMLVPLRAMLEDPAFSDQDLKQFTLRVAQRFARYGPDIDVVDKQIVQTLKEPMPRYSQAKNALRVFLVDLDEKDFAVAANRFAMAVDADRSQGSVTDKLLAVKEHLERARADINATVVALGNSQEVEDYDKLVGQLQNPEAIVLIGPQQVRIVTLGEMFREPDPNQIQLGQQPQLRFQGEEKITGALISMSLEHRPMVVFVNSGRFEALGRRGVFEQVAQRLRNVNFEVQQWGPMPRPGPMGQQIASGPPPEPQSGQKAVWVVLPTDAPSAANPTAAASGGQQIAGLLEQRMAAGDAALVMLSVNPMARFGSVDPISELLSNWGISPQTDRLILRQIVLPNHQHQASNQLNVDRWSSELPITRALAGMPGVFVQASPLVLGSGDGQEHLDVWPLVEISGDDLWTQRDLTSDPNPELDPTTAGGPFVIAAAAQRGDHRLVVVADPAWASDQITTVGRQGLPAEIVGAAFPANAELFVNSVFWLAALDQLIAVSPRTQDIRRVGPMTKAGLATLRWTLLLGLPSLVVVAGLSVWLARRRC